MHAYYTLTCSVILLTGKTYMLAAGSENMYTINLSGDEIPECDIALVFQMMSKVHSGKEILPKVSTPPQ